MSPLPMLDSVRLIPRAFCWCRVRDLNSRPTVYKTCDDPRFPPENRYLEPILWPWLAIAGLGAFHGLNPGMGWLFAVALGLHRQDRRIVWLALVPIVLGHAASVAAVALVFLWVGWFVDGWAFRVGTGLTMIGWALYHLRSGHRHRVRFGMRAGLAGLFVWSLLMATAHGAGLMLWPALMPVCLPDGTRAVAESGPLAAGLLGIGLHMLSMVSITAAIAATVYEWAGLEVLRRAWLNIDALWVTVLGVTGMLVLSSAF